jgi:catechol 2,3-dioxygenase
MGRMLVARHCQRCIMVSPVSSRPTFKPESPGFEGAILESERSPVFIGSATLVSRNAESLAAFYVEVLGFEHIRSDVQSVELGAGGVSFLRIENKPDASDFDPAKSGLFHIAYLLPDRAGLARWFLGARAAHAPFEGASDHAVSEAFYLSDPDGNGIEVYADRERSNWPRDAGGYAMTTGPMALRDLAASAGAATEEAPHLPAGTRIGHIHLQSGDAERAAHFWCETFDLAETHRRPGARFLSWGGYHHHIALNHWRSQGAGPRDAASTGLSQIEFSMRDTADFSALAAKSGVHASDATTLETSDPDGLKLLFRLA